LGRSKGSKTKAFTKSVKKKRCDSDILQPVIGRNFRRVRKITKKRLSFVIPVRPHGTTRIPLNGFSLNLILDYFSKICRENLVSIKIWQE